ncbi:MAG: hypothetical protein LUG26_09825 [Ruminococcus sp.]|nr:hypothetical protein [Ruminococcus sp.]
MIFSLFSGCNEGSDESNTDSIKSESDSSESADSDTEANEEDTQVTSTNTEAQPTTAMETQATEETTEIESAYEDAEIIDLSFLSSNQSEIKLTTRAYNTVESTVGEIDYVGFDIEVADTGESYLLGTSKIKYYLTVTVDQYNNFIDNAVDFDGEVQEGYRDGKESYQYNLIDNACDFECYSETFTLIRYYIDYNGRSTAEFVGEDGDYYYIYNDSSPILDDFTEELCYNIITLSSEQAYREITYDENSYIEISYDLGEELGIDLFFTRSPDFSTGNPGGAYYLDVNDDGSIAKMEIAYA